MWSILTTEDTPSKITNISYYFIKKKLKKKKFFPECRFPLILIKICHVKMTSLIYFCPNRNRNRNLKTSKALLKSQAHQGTSLFTSAATDQRGFPKGGQEKLR